MRIVFMGTPAFALAPLRALLAAGHEVIAAVTQPDRPAGRGNKLTACPVKLLAQEAGIPVLQYERIRTEGVEALRALQPELFVTAAFGQILSRELLSIPQYGTINVHASLLPAYRGSAPINWCIINGERVAGVTTMLTDAGMDTGDMLLRRETQIGELETAGELSERLSLMGAELLTETLEQYPHGALTPTPQDEALASYQPMLKKEMGQIDWSEDARRIACKVRGMNPWPCAYTMLGGERLKLSLARAVEVESVQEQSCGTVVISSAKEGLFVACGKGLLELIEIQAPGAKRMSAKSYLQGKRIDVGTKLG